MCRALCTAIFLMGYLMHVHATQPHDSVADIELQDLPKFSSAEEFQSYIQKQEDEIWVDDFLQKQKQDTPQEPESISWWRFWMLFTQ